jgi:nucleoside 2-deoxyribosyltransferase
MHKLLVYLAAPFFTPAQLKTVEQIEEAINEAGLVFYSPRHDGVLQSMTPEERKANAKKIFRLNCSNIIHADAILAVLDEKDTGTTWELGFGYYKRRYNTASSKFRIFAYTSEAKAMNVMLQQSFDATAVGLPQLHAVLTAFAAGRALPQQEQTEKVY